MNKGVILIEIVVILWIWSALQVNLCQKLWQNIFMKIENCKLRTSGEHDLYINCFFFVLTFRTIFVHNMFSWYCELLKKINLCITINVLINALIELLINVSDLFKKYTKNILESCLQSHSARVTLPRK